MARFDFAPFAGGSVYLPHPRTRAAHSWIAKRLPAKAMRWRHIGDIAGRAIANRLRVQ